MPDRVAIGVMAHNEEANIARLLESVLAQTAGDRIARIIVVASGCTDDTCSIVETFSARDPRVKLLAQTERGGKVSAINLFLTVAKEPLLLVSGADMVFEPQTVAEIVAPFDDPDIGMVGAHPIPVNDPATFLGFASHLLWRLHHEVALIQPKMGELIAFRNIFRGLDPEMLADEVQVEHGVRSVGYRVAYAPAAIVRNRGPETIPEFLAQRTRWLAFNMQIEREQRIPVSTLHPSILWRALRNYMRADKPRLDWVARTALLELYCRVRARLMSRSVSSRKNRLWTRLASTKDVSREPSAV